ncbi:hypothetical protein [Capnocytophaga stomatis]|uniref:hypothetical protein n=1 Tax=Capnocytophaga stomatis TaxID=1848904 RepID=UPI001ACD335C|nr:hypothetical protein [Capnocytophaga stomatis]GIM50562.1 hypothetical protein CAPN003_20140 [Capnocytophaga stomatis]
MKILFKIILLFLFGNITQAQTSKEINLPEGGWEIQESDLYFEYNTYVTKNQKVTNMKDRQISNFNEISSFMLSLKNTIPPHIWILPSLYADAETDFSFVERIIRQMALVGIKIKFVTQLKGKNQEIIRLAFTLLRSDSEKIIPLEEKNASDESHQDETDFFSPPPPPAPWYFIVHTDMYSGNPQRVKSVLTEYKYGVLKVFPNRILEYQGKPLVISDLPKVLMEKEILFFRFDKELKYKDYIYALDMVNKATKKAEAQKGGSSYLIDVFSELEDFLEENNIEL